MTEEKIWPGQIQEFLTNTKRGLEYKIVARDSFQSQEGDICVDDQEQEGDIVLLYNATLLEHLVERGKVSKEMVEPLLEDFVELESQRSEFRKFVEENPEATEEEKGNEFKKITNFKKTDGEKHAKKTMSIRRLIPLKEAVEEARKALEITPLFKRNLRAGKDFGVTKVVMDRLVYLPNLLENAELKQIDGGKHFFIKAKFPSKKRLNQKEKNKSPIGLEYSIVASDRETAKKTFQVYKKEMAQDALKVLLGFWKMANEQGMFDYTAGITEIMKMISVPSRESYFSTKEKKRFWALARLLENTKLTLQVPVKGTKKGWTVEHRLIEISARDFDKGENRGYPNRLKVRVLNPEEFKDKAQIATAIADGTLQLPPNEVMMALTIQTRGAQRREAPAIQYDEDYLVKMSHLEKTRKSNPRVARQRIKQKLDREVESGVISNWGKTKPGYNIQKIKRLNDLFSSSDTSEATQG